MENQMEQSAPPSSAFDSQTFDLDISIKVDKPVGSMSISPSGRDVVLASRQGLHIIDLDSLYSPPRELPHYTPWEVADVQWSPFAIRDHWVVSTSNQKALVWNLGMKTSQGSIEHVLHAHTRAITDINFSAHHPDILATCAVDSFVHCWDLRHPVRPVMTFCDWFAGATQVKWNRQESHIIASSHDRYLRIWDDRKGAYPLRSIEAHETKIYGIDWNRSRPEGIVTCSLDKAVKFWDYSKHEDEPERVIRTPFPVWRSRHTPFGWGVLAMPQRGNNELHLYDRRLSEGIERDATVPPVHSFHGHQGQVKEFLWRSRGDIASGIDDREFQLVTWGTDQYLRLHRIDDRTLRDVGFEKGKEVRKKYNLTRQNAVYRTFRGEGIESERVSQPPQSVSFGFHVESETGGTPRGALITGMSKAPIPMARGWGDGGFMTSRNATQGRSGVTRDVDPIAWMKGVKIGSRKPGMLSGRNSLPGGKSPFSPPYLGDSTWDTPESLGDEITYVGEKFSRVTFERVDVQNRIITVSLNGPWGAEGIPVFVKIEIKFPNDYPEVSIPIFKAEKTSSISEQTISKVSAALVTIAESYAARRRGCLEAALCYLLGERGLEDSTAWHMGELEAGGLDATAEVGGFSSDEEDDDLGNLTGLQSQDMELSGTDLLGQTNANANVPVPKACGAMWADNGRLVCFFPPKEDKAKSLLGTLALKESDRTSRDRKIFEGFGRLHTGSPGPKDKLSSINGDEGDQPDLSDESFTSSSSSSTGSAESNVMPHSGLQQPYAWRGSSLRIHRAISTDHSQRSSAAVTTSKTTPVKPRTIVSIHNFEDILPARRYLAEAYTIFGNGPDICAHNAKVAADYGFKDLADSWALAKLILHNEVPLEIMSQPYRKEHVLVVAARAHARLRRKDSGVDLSFDNSETRIKQRLIGRVKWGQHPFGGHWLIEELFKHFEDCANIQMLAMLSCVFSEPAAKEGVWNSMMQLRQHEMPMEMKTPAFSLDYFASEEVAWSLYQPNIAVLSAPKISHTPLGAFGSASSSNGPWSGDHSTGTTPPLNYKGQRMNVDSPETRSQSLSTSPDLQRTRRSNSNLASMFTASFSKPFSGVVSSSPPAQYKKRLSPVESVPANAVTWGTNTFFGASSTNKGTPFAPSAPHSLDGSDTDEDLPPPGEATIKVTLKNQNLFDNESLASIPLLDPKQSSRYRAYREAYANLLDVWNLPFVRCEVLKFNGLSSYFPSAPRPGEDSSLLTLGKLGTDPSTDESTLGLDVARHCTNCGDILQVKAQAGAAGRCKRCARNQNSLACMVCMEVILGLYVPCLNCGHVTHTHCHSIWFSDENNTECIACTCECPTHLVVQVKIPEREQQQQQEMEETEVESKEQAVEDEEDNDGWEDEPWDTVGFTPLGRGAAGIGFGSRLNSKSFVGGKPNFRGRGALRREKSL
ncbi:MAG: hypothetical protein M1812_002353 [Candelaria pacifica]|nr:MAG: hypothetical protein M1812_002353 [Candelaria pacifica]